MSTLTGNLAKALKILGIVLVALVILSAVVSTLSPVKFFISYLIWNEEETFWCSRDGAVTFENKEFSFDGTIFEVSGDCRLTLENCTLRSTEPISCSGNAEVRIVGGKIVGDEIAIAVAGGTLFIQGSDIEGKDVGVVMYDGSASIAETTIRSDVTGLIVSTKGEVHVRKSAIEAETAIRATAGKTVIEGGTVTGRKLAIDASSNSIVVLAGPQLTGEIKKRDAAAVTSPGKVEQARAAARKAADEEEEYRRYGDVAFEGLVECFEESRAFGNIDATVVMTVDADGQVTGAECSLGEVQGEVTKCIKETCLAKKIPDFRGPGGKLTCGFAGQVVPGTRKLSVWSDYVQNVESAR